MASVWPRFLEEGIGKKITFTAGMSVTENERKPANTRGISDSKSTPTERFLTLLLTLSKNLHSKKMN